MSKLNEGDVVRLKSGGPKMTVMSCIDDAIKVLYAQNNGHICEKMLTECVLELASHDQRVVIKPNPTLNLKVQ